MAKKCLVCRNERRAAIDESLVGNVETLQSIAGRFGVSKSGLLRHQGHIRKAITKAVARRQVAEAKPLLEQADQLEAIEALDGNTLIRKMISILAETDELLADAKRDKDGRLRAVVIHQARMNLETLAKFLIELKPRPALTGAQIAALSDEELDAMLEAAGVPVDELQDRAIVERPVVLVPAAAAIEARPVYLGTGQSSAGHPPPADETSLDISSEKPSGEAPGKFRYTI